MVINVAQLIWVFIIQPTQTTLIQCQRSQFHTAEICKLNQLLHLAKFLRALLFNLHTEGNGTSYSFRYSLDSLSSLLSEHHLHNQLVTFKSHF